MFVSLVLVCVCVCALQFASSFYCLLLFYLFILTVRENLTVLVPGILILCIFYALSLFSGILCPLSATLTITSNFFFLCVPAKGIDKRTNTTTTATTNNWERLVSCGVLGTVITVLYFLTVTKLKVGEIYFLPCSELDNCMCLFR